MDRKTKTLKVLAFRDVFLVAFAIFVLMAVVCSALIYSSTINSLKTSRYDVVRQLSSHTADISNSTVYLSDKVTSNLVPVLLKKDHNPSECQATLVSLVSDDIDLLQNTGLKVDVTIIMRNGETYCTSNLDDYMKARIASIQSSYWYITNFTNGSSSFWTAMIENVSNVVQFNITFGYAIRGDDGEYEGVVLTSVNDNILNDLGAFFSDQNSMLYILDEDGKAIAHSIRSLTSTSLYYMPAFISEYGFNTSQVVKRNHGSVLLTNCHEESNGWTIVEERDLSHLFPWSNSFYLLTLGLLLLTTLGMASIVSLILSRQICLPLTRLQTDVVKQQENEFNSAVTERKEYREIYEISTIYNKGVEKMKFLMERMKEEEHQKHLNELSFLQAQINPHFIHNTLLNIRCLMEMRKYQEVMDMLATFSGVLKYSIPNSNVFIGINEEVEYLEKYVHLLALRYSDHNISFDVNISEDASHSVLPRMLLQPLVENSIVHGMSGKVNDLEISLFANVDSDGKKLKIRVADNGIGMSEETLRNIHKPRKSSGLYNHIGISNIEDRIRLIYGDKNGYGLYALSEEGYGTEVIIEIENRRIES